jgi:hypothetical protein
MPDTAALQKAFGQSTEPRPGCGFPVARLLGLFHAGTGLLLQLVVAPRLTHDLAQAGGHAVRRGGARQIVDVTPGRPCVRPRVRRTPAVKGLPRSRWLKALGIHDPLVAWLTPQTCPSWLTREALAALPETLYEFAMHIVHE